MKCRELKDKNKKQDQIKNLIIISSFIIFFSIICFNILYFRGLNKSQVSDVLILPNSFADLYQKIKSGTQGPIPSTRPNEKGVKIPILMYHYISVSPWKEDKTRVGLSTSPYIFEQQIKQIKNDGFNPISLDNLIDVFAGRSDLPRKPIIFTFDDGYEDFYKNAFPLLKKHQVVASVFIITSFVGLNGYLTWDQIKEMDKSGLVYFGAHTQKHPALTILSNEIAKAEISLSKTEIEARLGHLINWFAYPYGLFNKQIVNEVRSSGFIGAVTTIKGDMEYESRLFYAPRIRVGTATGQELVQLIK
jgi:peptidoglycan/xylan/chitin deacetylase (PgdA/CDA1 family)